MPKNSNSMHRILDFNHEEPQEVLRRIAAQLHRSIDQNFPPRESSSATPIYPKENTTLSAITSDDTLVQFIPPNKKAVTSTTTTPDTSTKKKESISTPPLSYSDQSRDKKNLESSSQSFLTSQHLKQTPLALKIFWVGAITLTLSAAMAWWLYQLLVAT